MKIQEVLFDEIYDEDNYCKVCRSLLRYGKCWYCQSHPPTTKKYKKI